MNDQLGPEHRIRGGLTGYASKRPAPDDRWGEVVAAVGRARVRRLARVSGAAMAAAAIAGILVLTGNPFPDRSAERVATAPGAAPKPLPARAGDWDESLFARPGLWPFRGPEEAREWEKNAGQRGASAYARPADTALAFTRSYLGFHGLDRVVNEEVRGTRARVAIGYLPEGTETATAAVILLTRTGASAEGPWQVVGTDPGADPDLEITTADASLPAVVTVGGVITGVDESLRIQVRQPSSPEPLGESCCTGAGGRQRPWKVTVATKQATDPVLTVVVVTGGHVADAERFEVIGLVMPVSAGGDRG